MSAAHRFFRIPSRALLLVCLLLAVARCTHRPEPKQLGLAGEDSTRYSTSYYYFDTEIPAWLDTSIWAIQLPLGEPLETASKALTQEDLEQRLHLLTDDDADYVKEFKQENVLFFRANKDADPRDIREQIYSQVPTLKRLGHPLFAEGERETLVASDELVVQLRQGVPADEIKTIVNNHHLKLLESSRCADEIQYLLRVTPATGATALEIANRLQKSGKTLLAHPNFWAHIDHQSPGSGEPSQEQWHLHNDGGNGMAKDADIDAHEAWGITRGSPETIIAVLDLGFEVCHPDLAPNRLINRQEIAGDRLDNDGNGYINDLIGWSFPDDSDDVRKGLDPDHGQAVAGLAAATGQAGGPAGVCPGCRFLPISIAFTAFDLGRAFCYAADRGASVITNSWNAPEQASITAAIRAVATKSRNGLGSVIFAATLNNPDDPFGYPASDPYTIAVGGSDCKDGRYLYSQAGPELTLLAPTAQAEGVNRCRGLVTTGTNNTIRGSFGGTSGATPIAAGVAGLLLSVGPQLDRLQVQQLLQDTADRVEPQEGRYSCMWGYSTANQNGRLGWPLVPTHGWGRVNAFEAVRVTAPVARGGRGGKDLFLRDNCLDWGNTEQPSSAVPGPANRTFKHDPSPSIWLDAPPYQPASSTVDALHQIGEESPRPGERHRVLVVVRNRGYQTVDELEVSLHWALVGHDLPPLPSGIWKAPATASNADWHAGGTQRVTRLAYSGASRAGCPGRKEPPCLAPDDAQVVRFSLQLPTLQDRQRYRQLCLLVALHSSEDPVSPHPRNPLDPVLVSANDNNVAYRCFALPEAG